MASALSTYEMLWDDTEVAARIDTGIERHRKANAEDNPLHGGSNAVTTRPSDPV